MSEDQVRDRRITPVILCGGSGTRLWPMSRKARPKQLLALNGPQTMLQMTAARVADDARFGPPVLVVGAGQAELAQEQLNASGVTPGAVIVEPAARNTAAAIALAALAGDPDALLLVMPSDHFISDPAGLMAAAEAAASLAEEGWLITFGIRPDRPETGYGYIQRGEKIGERTFRVQRFVEKPDAATAAAYVDVGEYEWNSGIFLLSAKAYLEALDMHASDIAADVTAAMNSGRREGHRIHPDPAAFARIRPQSIDHAVMEHAAQIAMVPVEIGWSDVGSWAALYDSLPCDADGNAVTGEAVAIDTKGCLIRSDGPMIVAIGVEDLAIIASGDSILIVPRGQSQRVQEVVKLLGERGDSSRL